MGGLLTADAMSDLNRQPVNNLKNNNSRKITLKGVRVQSMLDICKKKLIK